MNTLSPATAGDESTGPVEARSHMRAPLSAFSAMMRLSPAPRYSRPSTTAGVDTSGASVSKRHLSRPPPADASDAVAECLTSRRYIGQSPRAATALISDAGGGSGLSNAPYMYAKPAAAAMSSSATTPHFRRRIRRRRACQRPISASASALLTAALPSRRRQQLPQNPSSGALKCLHVGHRTTACKENPPFGIRGQ